MVRVWEEDLEISSSFFWLSRLSQRILNDHVIQSYNQSDLLQSQHQIDWNKVRRHFQALNLKAINSISSISLEILWSWSCLSSLQSRSFKFVQLVSIHSSFDQSAGTSHSESWGVMFAFESRNEASFWNSYHLLHPTSHPSPHHTASKASTELQIWIHSLQRSFSPSSLA